MKKFSWKKFMSLALVAALVVGTLQFSKMNVSADDAQVTDATATLTKTITQDTENSKKFTVKLEATTTPYTVNNQTTEDVPVSVVLVIDTSNSMNDDSKIGAAKEAAKSFADAILGVNNGQNNNKVAVVTYGTYANVVERITTRTFISATPSAITVGNTEYYVRNNADEKKINFHKVVDSTEAGVDRYTKVKYADQNKPGKIKMKEAYQLDPNGQYVYGKYEKVSTSLGLTSAANLSELKTAIGQIYTNGGTNTQDGIQTAVALLNTDNSNNNKVIVLLSDGEATYSYNENGWLQGTGSDYELGYYDWFGFHATGGNNGDPAIAAAKNSGYTFYTVSYGTDVDENEELLAMMKSIAGKEANYKTATTVNISDILAEIATKISTVSSTSIVEEGTFVDYVPSYFKVTVPEGATVTKDANGIQKVEFATSTTPTSFEYTIELDYTEDFVKQNGTADKKDDGSTVYTYIFSTDVSTENGVVLAELGYSTTKSTESAYAYAADTAVASATYTATVTEKPEAQKYDYIIEMTIERVGKEPYYHGKSNTLLSGEAVYFEDSYDVTSLKEEIVVTIGEKVLTSDEIAEFIERYTGKDEEQGQIVDIWGIRFKMPEANVKIVINYSIPQEEPVVTPPAQEEPVVTPPAQEVIVTPPAQIIEIVIPTQAPEEPVEEIPVEETKTPEAPVEEAVVTEEPVVEAAEEVEEVIEETETPEAAVEEVEEEVIEETETPQGDLPKTGVVAATVLYGIGAACVGLGGTIVLKSRRKEEE